MSEAQALEAAHQAAAQQAQAVTPPTANTAPQPAEQQADALSNEAMVWEMLYAGDNYALPTAEGEAAWRRAMGKEEAAEQEVSVHLLLQQQHPDAAVTYHPYHKHSSHGAGGPLPSAKQHTQRWH